MSGGLLDLKDADYAYAPIAYHDSWLSVDPIIGCRLNCQYCFMQTTHWTAVKPEQLFTLSEIVEQVISHRYFIPHQTILVFGNQTDSFLPDNADFTLRFFEALEEQKFKNPIAVVTKKQIPAQFLERATQFEYVRPIFCLSYSGLPGSIEKGVNPKENQTNFKNLSQRGLRVIHFWRPLIAENGSPAILEHVLDWAANHAMASVYIGLKISPSLYRTYTKISHIQIPKDLDEQYGDYIPEGVEARLRTIAAEKYPNYPLYKHTSCAVSLALGIPDYNATLYNDPICKGSNCPASKRAICEAARGIPSHTQVEQLISPLGLECDFTITNQAIEINGEISQEDYAYLLHQLNYPIKAHVKYTRNLWGSIFREKALEKQVDREKDSS